MTLLVTGMIPGHEDPDFPAVIIDNVYPEY
jgi:hypothetical protein